MSRLVVTVNDEMVTILQPVCPDCGEDVSSFVRDFYLDWRDDRERTLGQNADAVQQHRAAAHEVVPKLGDLVVYSAAWRGLIIGNGPLRVENIWHDDERGWTHYRLVNPSRPSDYYLPFTGDEDRPITFALVDEYVVPAVEVDLFALLGAEWMETTA